MERGFWKGVFERVFLERVFFGKGAYVLEPKIT